MCLSFCQRLPKVQLMLQVCSFISSLSKFSQNSFFPWLRKTVWPLSPDMWWRWWPSEPCQLFVCLGDNRAGCRFKNHEPGLSCECTALRGTSPTNSQQTFTNTTAEPWNRIIYMQGVLCFMANIQSHHVLLFKKKPKWKSLLKWKGITLLQ